jgi:hypothetical protein
MGRAYTRFTTLRGHSLKPPGRRAIGKPRLRPLIKRAIGSSPSRVPVVIAMAFSEVDLKRIEETAGIFCGIRSPRHLKEKLCLMYAVKGHEVVIVERRPWWDNQTEWTETPVAAVLDAG